MVKVCKSYGEGTIAGTLGNGEDAPKAVALSSMNSATASLASTVGVARL
jgi:hypothetical protein